MSRGVVCRLRTCPRCLRDLAPTSGGDCPHHTLPCCGGKGASHEPGCEQSPAYLAGRRTAQERERRLIEAIMWTP